MNQSQPYYLQFLKICKIKGFTVLIVLFVFGVADVQGQLIGRIGASVGNGFQNKELKDINGDDFKLQENNVAWKIFAGTRWKFLGLEGGYRDFGEVESNSSTGLFTTRSRGGDIYATGTVTLLKILAVFGKAGAYFGKTKTNFKSSSTSDSFDDTERQTSFAWGLGGAVNLGMLHVRLEYENMEINDGNLGMLSLGVGINLGERGK
jgi:opacity protein-like surface antigen